MVRRYLTTRRIVLLMAAILLAIGWWKFSPDLSPDYFQRHEAELRDYVRREPLTAFVTAYFVFVGLSLIPGTRGKAVIVGWLFGMVGGVAVVNVGLTTAAVTSFLISRRFLRDALYSRYGFYLDRLNQALARHGVRYLLLLRALGVAPFTFTNYACGTTTLPLRTFWWTTQLGLLPGNLVFVYVGASLPSLDLLVTAGIGSLLTPKLVAILVGLSLLPILVGWLHGRLLQDKASRQDA